MITLFSRLGFVVLAVYFLPQAFAGDSLKHDPFARPLLSTPLPSNTAAGTVVEEEIPWNPQLIAVMVSGKNSLVNLDGIIIKIGEEKDGYRLVQVRDQEAIFKKGNKRIVLNMEMSTLRKNKERGGE